MAARKNKIFHDEDTRKKIQASAIINRLFQNVMGEISLDAQQVSSAKTLLNKVLPDLSAISVEAEIDGDIKHEVTIRIVDSKHDDRG